MKMITEKQKKFINDIKGVITENGINAIDALDLNKFTCYDASKLIGGLLGFLFGFIGLIILWIIPNDDRIS